MASKTIQPSGKAKRCSIDNGSSRRVSLTSNATANEINSPTLTETSSIGRRDSLYFDQFETTKVRSRSLDNCCRVAEQNISSRRYQSCLNLPTFGFFQNESPVSSNAIHDSASFANTMAKRKKPRPPPLVLSAVNSAAQVEPKCAQSKNGANTKNKPNYLLEKSKAILNSFPDHNESVKIYNPFPTKRQTTMIERGKRLGLYS